MPLAKRIGLLLGPSAFLALVAFAELGTPGPSAPSGDGIKVAAVAALMAAWWITEAVPIPITSLLPLVLFPALGVGTAGSTAPFYMDRFIVLLMGGFFVALSLEKWDLHKRIALGVVLAVGARPDRLILGFMVACAALSMWISNTATALMMMPIGLAVLTRMEARFPGDPRVRPIGVGLLLGIAYACNIGGIGTPIGTPPNVIFIGVLGKTYGSEAVPSFFEWMLMTLPIVAIMVVLIWLVLTRVVNRIDPDLDAGERGTLLEEKRAMGLMTPAQKRVAIVFGLTALAWLLRRNIPIGDIVIPGWSNLLGLAGKVDDGTVAIAATVLMFLVPAGGDHIDERLLDWETAVRIPWGLLLLFGGGLALAGGFQSSGLSAWIGQRLGTLASLPPWLLMAVVCVSVTFLTEVTSNTATTTVLMPVLASVALENGIDPMLLMLPAALSASCAFMLPVATAPNAIVFGTGRVGMLDMVRCGVAINLIGVAVITAVLLIV